VSHVDAVLARVRAMGWRRMLYRGRHRPGPHTFTVAEINAAVARQRVQVVQVDGGLLLEVDARVGGPGSDRTELVRVLAPREVA